MVGASPLVGAPPKKPAAATVATTSSSPIPSPSPVPAPSPIPFPLPSPSPAPSPSPIPSPSLPAGLTISSEPFNDATAAAYREARAPQTARIALASEHQAQLEPRARVSDTIDTRAGVSDTIALPAASGSAPDAATVTLQFAANNAGKSVWVQALDGGTINGTPGGRFLELDAAGALAFLFQAPAASARYQITVRLDNVESLLAFAVYDPAQLSARTRQSSAATGR